MSQSHRIEGETADEAFQGQRFLWERGDLIGVVFDLLNFQVLSPAQERTLNTEGKQKKNT